ncbi:MAG: hydroxymethylbilane synthase [Magnetococcus sp. DMHC-6]
MNETIRIGTRGSALAIWQASWVKSRLESLHPGLQVELIGIKTRGDKILDVPLAKVGGKGLFVKELEESLLDLRTDLAVHSMKDVPSEFPNGLMLGAILEREDPWDVLLSVKHASLETLPMGAKVGSSSLRRQSQLLHLRPDLEVIPLRGNVNTRIDKLEKGQFDAILLAAAGVNRLGLLQYVRQHMNLEQMVPAAGQGAVGIEVRCDDQHILNLIAPLDHLQTRVRVLAERSFLAALEGGCQVPISSFALLKQGQLHLTGRVGNLDGTKQLTESVFGSINAPEELGKSLAAKLLHQGADQILAQIYRELDG